MKKNKKKPSRLWLVVLIIIIAAVLALYLSKDWLKRAYYGYEARTAFSSQLNKLGPSLDTLGFKNISKEPSKCSDESIFGYALPQLQCQTGYQNYVVIGKDEQSKALFNAKAQQLDSLLKSGNWSTTSNSASSISQWFQGITSGKDYSTDIDSVENSGHNHCSLVFNVAYSNPKPPAFEVRLSCASPILEKEKDLAEF